MSKVQTAVTHAVELDQVVVRFRSKKTNITAFREVSLRVVEAEFVTIVGPSGCGKSTLLKLASGLLQPSNDDVWLRGDAVTEPRRDVGYVFQCAVLLDWRAARRNILLPARCGACPGQGEQRTDELIAMTVPRRLRVCVPAPAIRSDVAASGALPCAAAPAAVSRQIRRNSTFICSLVSASRAPNGSSISRSGAARDALDAEAVYLADRAVMMTARPGTVAGIIDVDVPAERDYVTSMVFSQSISVFAGKLATMPCVLAYGRTTRPSASGRFAGDLT
jgi:NitT/TauT family transport system ATP-binding protein